MKKSKFINVNTIISFSFIMFAFTVLALLIYYLFIDFWSAFVVFVFFACFGTLTYWMDKISKLKDKGPTIYTERIKKQEKVISFIMVTFLVVILLGIAVGGWYAIGKGIKENLLYKKVSNNGLIEALQKSKDEVKNALISIDSSIDTLNDSRSKIDALIINSQRNKEEFINQISKLNEAEEVVKGLDNRRKVFEKQIFYIQKITGGKKILTIEDFDKNKIRDLIFAFLTGIITSILGTLFLDLLKNKRKHD